ncbi:hypothetical protein FACS1894152_0940 [Bacilli bacterium]|nr:hypothetical protein FACS1894152_0940 [Bacilli bacterium]
MGENIAIRQELHTLIDSMAERNLYALKPLLTILVSEQVTIETDLSSEEHAIIADSVERYHRNPHSFVPLEVVV